MELRHILAAIIVLLFSVGMALLISFGILTYYPQFVGIDKDGHIIEKNQQMASEDSIKQKQIIYEEELPTMTTVEVTLDKIERYEYELQTKQKLLNDNDSLIKVSQCLMDSISSIFKETKGTLDSINIIHKALGKARNANSRLKDSLSKISSTIASKDDKIEKLSKELEAKDKLLAYQMDSLDAQHYRNLAKIYNSSKPEEVAKILEQIDPQKAAIVLRLMRAKNSGQVFDAMNPATAAEILLLGSSPLPPETK
jgi:flagellar motility protein MotE (MotC chaperone)